MDAKVALDRLQDVVADLRRLLQQARSGELDATAAVQRSDAVLGPPVRGDPVAPGSTLAATVRTYEQLVNQCRLALDRDRAGMVGHADTLEAIEGLVGLE